MASTQIVEEFISSDFHFRFGFQAHPYFVSEKDKKHQIIFGAIFDMESNIDIDYKSITNRRFPAGFTNPLTVDTFNIITDSATNLILPVKYGLGLSYNYDDRIMVTLEYSKQLFSKGIGWSTSVDLQDYASYRFGLEYVPMPMSDRNRASYFKRVHYRMGAHYTNSYISLRGDRINDYGISVGIGLPWRNAQKLYTHTSFNISYEYGVLGTTDNGLIKENYHIISVGITLHDFWFMKPKYD
jgi:hypothetical protein